MLEIALIENIQREDLNAMEIAINYQRLLDECALKHEELAERVGKNRSTVTNYLRLLRLPPEVQHAIKDGDLSMGHARTLVALQDPVAQIALAKEIRAKSLSVRQAEKLAASYKPGKNRKKGSDKGNLDPQIRRWQDSMASSLSARVQIKPGRGGRGEVVIQYHSEDDLHRLAELLGDS
jgi:ParB family chromosome partitioning protein